jgi:tryptophan 2,3-dioxygenase
VTVLETMTPLDFLDFRDMLYPASGFQSLQFRLIENKLGLKSENRHNYNSQAYHSYVAQAEAEKMLAAEAEPSLFDLLDKWLARTPFLEDKDFKFWEIYQKAVTAMYDRDRVTVRANPMLTPEDIAKNLTNIDEAAKQFHALYNEKEFSALQAEGHYRLSYRAIHAALLVSLYRDEPMLHLPYQVIAQLIELDERMTMWRYRHALMAQRMLGSKIGTGGSSGHKYLKSATERHRIFEDLVNLTTFFIPRSELPELPEALRKRMSFRG